MSCRQATRDLSISQAPSHIPLMTLGLYAQVIASKADHGAAPDALVTNDDADTGPATPASV